MGLLIRFPLFCKFRVDGISNVISSKTAEITFPGETKRSVASIQYLRAFAVILVAITHIPGTFIHQGFDLVYDLGFGQVGVDIFFIVSGFIMLHIEHGRGLLSLARFLWRRIVRILPLYWIFTFFVMGLYVHQKRHVSLDPDIVRNFFYSYFFWPYAGHNDPHLTYPYPTYPIGWTLNYEMFFYTVFSMTLLIRRSWRVYAAAVFLVGLAIAGQIVDMPMPSYIWSRSNIVEFVYGMAIAEVYRRGFSMRPIFGAGLTAVAFTLFAIFYVSQNAMVSVLGDYVDDVRFISWGMPSALLVSAAVFTRLPSYLAFAPVALFLGDASYSIYLAHLKTYETIIPLVIHITGSRPNAYLLTAACLTMFILAVAAGCTVYLFVELPLYKFMRNLTFGRTKPAMMRSSDLIAINEEGGLNTQRL